VPNYLIERYVPAGRRAEIGAAIAGMSAGDRVRHLRATFVPDDETCFHVVEAASREAVRQALKRAAITYERLVEADDGSTLVTIEGSEGGAA
jgi:hypothetical protein